MREIFRIGFSDRSRYVAEILDNMADDQKKERHRGR
jgi:hypothetical protein